MKRNRRKIEIPTTVLHELQPNFISLVDHGANQTPFNVVKSVIKKDKPNILNFFKIDVLKELGLELMKPEIQSLRFDKKAFSLEQVEKYLKDRDYSEFDIEDVEKSYVVKAANLEDFENVREIQQDAGVVATVGDLKKTVEKSAVQKLDENGNSPASNVTPEDLGAEKPADETPKESAKDETPAEVGDADQEPVTEETSSEDAATEERQEDAREAEGEPALETSQETPDAEHQEESQTESQEESQKSANKNIDFIQKKEGRNRLIKFDWYAAYYAEAETFQDYLKAGDDGIPPSYYDVIEAFATTFTQALKAKDPSAMDSNYNQFKDYMQKWVSLIDSETQKSVVKPSEKELVLEKALASQTEMLQTLTKSMEALTKSLSEIQESHKEQENRLKTLEEKPNLRKGLDGSLESKEKNVDVFNLSAEDRIAFGV